MYQPSIRPSVHFTAATVAKVLAASRRGKLLTDLLTPLVIFSPWLFREIWLALFHGRDYFTVGRWPLADWFLRSYQLFVSHLLTYLLLGAGAVLVALYFLIQRTGSRRWQQFLNLPNL